MKKSAISIIASGYVPRTSTILDGVIHLAQIIEWNGCIALGNTQEEALTRLGEVAVNWVEQAQREGVEIPPPHHET